MEIFRLLINLFKSVGIIFLKLKYLLWRFNEKMSSLCILKLLTVRRSPISITSVVHPTAFTCTALQMHFECTSTAKLLDQEAENRCSSYTEIWSLKWSHWCTVEWLQPLTSRKPLLQLYRDMAGEMVPLVYSGMVAALDLS